MFKKLAVLATLTVVMAMGLSGCKLDFRQMPNTDTSTTP
jgi:hypothetical protein